MSGAAALLIAAAAAEEEAEATQAALQSKAPGAIGPALDDELKAGAKALEAAVLALAELRQKVEEA